MNIKEIRVIITGASPDKYNTNKVMRNYVTDGFKEIIGLDNVLEMPLEICHQHITIFKPTVVVLFGSCMPDESKYGALRRACEDVGAVMVFWLHDDPYEFDFNYRAELFADYIFTNDKWAARHYDSDRVYHLPMAASYKNHFREINSEKDIDIFFCGVGFENRIRLVNDLSKVLAKCDSQIFGDNWPQDKYRITKNIRINNSDLPDYYSKSKVTLNIGRHLNLANSRYMLPASTPGPRTFEAAMAGTVQLYFVESLEIEEYYMPQEEILLFDNPNQFEEIIDLFLNNDRKLNNIAHNAQVKTMERHTYKNRAEAMLNVIRRDYK